MMADKKKKKVEKKAQEEKPELSVIDMARHEQKAPREIFAKPDGSGKQYTREAFKMWCVLPDIFKGAPERITSLLGVMDPVTIELLGIPTMTRFAEEFGCSVHTLTRWKREVEESDQYMDDVRRAMRPLTKNVMAALYRKMLEEGDGPRFTAWMKVVEGWREQLGVEHSGTVGDSLSPEERDALDKLIAKNTQ